MILLKSRLTKAIYRVYNTKFNLINNRNSIK